MSFMTYEIIQDNWLVIENDNGTTYLPMTNLFVSADIPDIDDVQVYVDGNINTKKDMEIKNGWGCRLTAPGYMDCTDWSAVFKTEKEAAEYLIEMYGGEFEFQEDWDKELCERYNIDY